MIRTKQDAREAYLKRLQLYWNQQPHRFNTRVGEIYEVDFGENVGDEFSGRHLGVCLENTSPSQTKTVVVPLTTKYANYNINSEDVIHTTTISDNIAIDAGVCLGEARWISKLRIFPRSAILKEPPNHASNYAKAFVEIDAKTLKRWRKL
jgi:mRNA-degrading endonuclease toxin of MazEF toxin-antitoxin module